LHSIRFFARRLRLGSRVEITGFASELIHSSRTYYFVYVYTVVYLFLSVIEFSTLVFVPVFASGDLSSLPAHLGWGLTTSEMVRRTLQYDEGHQMRHESYQSSDDATKFTGSTVYATDVLIQRVGFIPLNI
jgi:hypothetical protein